MWEPVHVPPAPSGPSRRSFLAAAAGALVAPGVLARPRLSQPGTPEAKAAETSRGTARNVIFMVADGMSAGTLTMADTLAHMRSGRSLRWVELWSDPRARRASQATASADAYVTDSAAAGSAWGIGEHVNNNALNVTPDGRKPSPILVRARAAGKATGLVSTARVTHATPASFLANVPHRDSEVEIARQYLERGFDVALGGGAKFFPPGLIATSPGLRVVRTRDELLKAAPAAPPPPGGAPAPAAPLLGLFTPEHMHYDIDRPVEEPSLADMARAALDALSGAPNGFLLQIEGGRVDHGAHANDPGGMLFDLLAFDDALGVVLDFALAREDTLVIVTTDHGTANPGLTFYSRDGIKRFSSVRVFSRSFEWILEQSDALPAPQRAEALPALVRTATGIALSADEAAILGRCVQGQLVDPFSPSNTLVTVLGSLIANWTGIAFASPNHTSDFVEVTAVGPGSAALAPLVENTELHALMTGALGLPAATD